MSQPPSIQRFYTEDYKDAPSWFKKFLSTLNLFAFPVYNALNGGIGVQNLNVQYYSFSLTGNSTATSNKVTFQSTIDGTIHGVTIMQVQVTGTPTPVYLTAAPTVASWSATGSSISVQSITGLTTGVNYTLTLKVE